MQITATYNGQEVYASGMSGVFNLETAMLIEIITAAADRTNACTHCKN